MGWHNHDCNPNAGATIDADGRVRIESKRCIALGEEVNISYIDPALSVEERRATLEEHYGFRCNCERCKLEQRRALKSRIPTQRR